MTLATFEAYRREIRTRSISAAWRGYGSAIFLEIGQLSPRRRRDGSARSPSGEYTIMIEWSWRIESETSILGGSWSDEEGWPALLQSLIGRKVEDITLFGRLPELSITLDNETRVVSFMTADGQPAWSILKRHGDGGTSASLSVSEGALIEDPASPPVSR